MIFILVIMVTSLIVYITQVGILDNICPLEFGFHIYNWLAFTLSILIVIYLLLIDVLLVCGQFTVYLQNNP